MAPLLPAIFAANGSPLDFLRVENLPAVGLLLTFIVTAYVLFSRGVVRWGTAVDALLAEKEKRLAEKDAEIDELKADRDRWQTTAWNAGQTAKRLADTNRDAVTATAALAETVVAGGTVRPLRQKAKGGEAKRPNDPGHDPGKC